VPVAEREQGVGVAVLRLLDVTLDDAELVMATGSGDEGGDVDGRHGIAESSDE